jgi:hypothetical protein
MQKHLIGLGAGLLVAACAISEDPAEGGFFNGVDGLASGGYVERIDEREQAVAASTSRNADLRAQQQALQAQITASESELANLKITILQQKNAIGNLDAQTKARVNAVLNARSGGSTDQVRLAALQKTISDAKILSADLARLAG